MPSILWRRLKELYWIELARTKLEVILALTVRGFGVVDAYPEQDLPRDTAKRQPIGVSGERAYRFIRGGRYLGDFCPCKVQNLDS